MSVTSINLLNNWCIPGSILKILNLATSFGKFEKSSENQNEAYILITEEPDIRLDIRPYNPSFPNPVCGQKRDLA